MNNPELSIIIPVLNEEDSIKIQNDKIKKALEGRVSYEVIWVDDGSSDSTSKILEEISSKDPNVKAIILMRRVGQSGAIMAGLDNAQGQYIGTMDGDNQNDPDEFIAMLHKLEQEELDVVVGWRQSRWKGNYIRRIPSIVANLILQKSFSAIQIHDAGCPIKVGKTDVFKEVRLYGELHRFLSYILYMTGARIGELPINHRDREAGTSKYGISRTFKVLFDIVNIKFLMSKRTPIQIIGPIALFLYAIGSVLVTYLGYGWLEGRIDVSGSPYFLLSIMMFILGTQFIIFGLLGELVIRSYYENGTEKKTYMIRQHHN